LYLHTRHVPIVHRDLKSENILLTENFTVKICDFGMARLKLHSTHIETQHANAGTPAWMAPEVLRGEHFDEKADVYSFSIILWEILHRKVALQASKCLLIHPPRQRQRHYFNSFLTLGAACAAT
jgi:serine/threonine protein kinase